MEPDADLVRRALHGDERAMRALWTRHAAHVDAVVRRLVDDADQAADVAQEVWIQIFRALPSWREDARFSTWVHRVAVNRTLNALRGMKRIRRHEAPLDAETWDAEPGVPVVLPEGDRAFTAAAIAAAAAQLAPGARRIFYLHDVEGYTHEEIASALGITAGGSKSQLFKARARLRQLLAPLMETRRADAPTAPVAPPADASPFARAPRPMLSF